MLKLTYITIFIIFSNLSFAQIGINTTNPTNTLDINGTLKNINIETDSNPEYILTTSNSGEINKIKTDTFKKSYENQSVSDIAVGSSVVITNNSQLSEASIVITNQNACGRDMISSFISYSNSLVFIKGAARQTIASSSANSGEFSLKWNITFPGVGTCSDGNSTQFDFSLEKISDYEYKITNNANISKNYNISFLGL